MAVIITLYNSMSFKKAERFLDGLVVRIEHFHCGCQV